MDDKRIAARWLTMLAIVASGCGSRTPSSIVLPPPPTSAQTAPPIEPASPTHGTHVKIGKTVTLGDTVWVIVEATDWGKTVTGNSNLEPDMPHGDGTTDGRFVGVHYKLTNLGAAERMIEGVPKIVDERGREFGPMDMESLYVPEQAKTVSLATLPPHEQKEFWTVIALPPDAVKLRFEVWNFSAPDDKSLIPLGL